jgi:hypothetical protein
MPEATEDIPTVGLSPIAKNRIRGMLQKWQKRAKPWKCVQTEWLFVPGVWSKNPKAVGAHLTPLSNKTRAVRCQSHGQYLGYTKVIVAGLVEFWEPIEH